MSATIEDGKVVMFEYVLTNGDGEELDASRGNALGYLHGHDNIVPGLEREMAGRVVGDAFQVEVAPADGYGEKKPNGTQRLPAGAFGDTTPRIGEQYATRDDGGSIVPLWVTAVDAEGIEITFDHPLAGVTLHFDVRVTEIRDATKDELAHGHPHGPGGHHH